MGWPGSASRSISPPSITSVPLTIRYSRNQSQRHLQRPVQQLEKARTRHELRAQPGPLELGPDEQDPWWPRSRRLRRSLFLAPRHVVIVDNKYTSGQIFRHSKREKCTAQQVGTYFRDSHGERRRITAKTRRSPIRLSLLGVFPEPRGSAGRAASTAAMRSATSPRKLI